MEIQEHLAPGWGISFKEVGAEKLRFLMGHATFVTADAILWTNLSKWLDETAETLAVKTTGVEY